MSVGKDDHGLVSITIPTLNSEGTLHACLQAVASQTYDEVEVIIVDSWSTDGTRRIAEQFGAMVLSEAGLVRARFRGIRASMGEYILLLDSDQILDSLAVENCVTEVESFNVDGLILKEVSRPQTSSRLASTIRTNMKAIQTDPGFYTGVALPRFFRRSALADVDPPKRELFGFDHVYLYLQLLDKKRKIGFSSGSIYHHEHNTFPAFVRKYYRFYGLGFWSALKEDPRLVLGRSLPRSSYLKASLTASDILNLFALYILKAFIVGGGAAVGPLASLLAPADRR